MSKIHFEIGGAIDPDNPHNAHLVFRPEVFTHEVESIKSEGVPLHQKPKTKDGETVFSLDPSQAYSEEEIIANAMRASAGIKATGSWAAVHATVLRTSEVTDGKAFRVLDGLTKKQ